MTWLAKWREKRARARYEKERHLADNGPAAKRLHLAKNSKTHQEILYYLAHHDTDAGVRRAVAENSQTPLHASEILSVDPDVDVRQALAQRLLRLLPNLDQGRQSQLYAFAVQALGVLALDQVISIRRALSSALKDVAHAPPQVVAQLARDVEREVAEPILRFCSLLADEDLLNILKNHPDEWAMEAIVGRKALSGKLTRAIFATDDRRIGKILLGNAGAVIEEDLMHSIIEKSRHYTEWQQPLAAHAKLPATMARKLAEFADVTVREVLSRRMDFDEATVADITSIFQQRLERATQDDYVAESTSSQMGKTTDENSLSNALATRDRAAATAVLADLSGLQAASVERVLALKAPKPIIALSRKAGLPMRMALRLQQELAQVPHSELIYPRGGTDYPLSDEELARQLEFLGLGKS